MRKKKCQLPKACTLWKRFQTGKAPSQHSVAAKPEAKPVAPVTIWSGAPELLLQAHKVLLLPREHTSPPCMWSAIAKQDVLCNTRVPTAANRAACRSK